MRPALLAQVAVLTAVTAQLGAFLATLAAQQTTDLGAAPALRTLLVTAVLVVVPWWTVRPWLLRATRGQIRLGCGLGLALGYALYPAAWAGRGYAAELVTAPGTTTRLLDLVLWLVVGGAALLVVSAPAGTRESATYDVR
ncbi:chromate transport protein [Cellulomonas flavigena DSM 20109]|uniref:Chromate transport protein n=1 Tax=Cellulomonas flavigena (strain ATCC 482 / DSM 20109 / BCRC 11376 / JCM 18109 / NBRC 3775 / NCIMB 8073 / NRS 134) TaxID=446466 RepID=D5UI98_CELFN|nr:hypothetical protein [Cellulomonas flavigena]ADG75443.1 chromate transport protein [Cellulomonas flavigena DSM 20109]